MKITERIVNKDYEAYIQLAQKYANKGNVKQCLDCLSIASKISYTMNLNYFDQKIEDLLKLVSKNAVSCSDKKLDEEKIVFYDGVAIDNVVLSWQYIGALAATGKRILYLITTENNKNRYAKTIEYARSYKNVEVIEIDGKISNLGTVKKVNECILSFCAKTAFIQIWPYDAYSAMIWAGQNNINRYMIINADHLYCIGTKCVNNIIEFRDYGYTISKNVRNIDSNRIFVSTFYPVIQESQFYGMPKTDKVKLICGGSCYKIYGNNDIFFNSIKNILTNNNNAILYYVGNGNLSYLKKFLRRNSLEDRVVFLGYRKDIFEVISHCDIFIDTFPVDGGLLPQIAAYAGKPVVMINQNDLPLADSHELLGDNCENYVVRYTFNDYFSYIQELIQNENMRKTVGEKIKRSMVNKEEFDEKINQIIKGFNESRKEIDINYLKIHKYYYDIENNYLKRYCRINANKYYLRYNPFLFSINFANAAINKIFSGFGK